MQTVQSQPLRGDPIAAAGWRASVARRPEGATAARIIALAGMAREIRVRILRTIHGAGMGHVGGDLSVTDILATLYGAVLNIDPLDPVKPDRDRLILSKGHCAAALYTTLACCGFFDPARLGSFMAPMSPLNGHPNRRRVPGVETNTGPLGHGLPVAVGCATAARLSGAAWRTFVILGDGELQEGSNWEAAMYAGHARLDRLTAIVDRNGLQQGAGTEDTNGLEPLACKWVAFGWDVLEIDGHSHAALLAALATPHGARPRVVIARTVKGKGVSFMENRVEWHHKVPTDEQMLRALRELEDAA
jgi:transketolase